MGTFDRLSADSIDLDADGDLDLYLTGADAQQLPPENLFGAVPNQLFGNTTLAVEKAYVTNRSMDFVEVVEPRTGTVLKRLCHPLTPASVGCDEVGTGIGAVPHGVAVNTDGSRAYVTNSWFHCNPTFFVPEDCNSVVVIDGDSDTVLNRTPVGRLPFGVAVNGAGTRVYVTAALDGNVTVLTREGNPVGSPITVGVGPRGVAVHPKDDRVYVANEISDTISILDVTTDPGQVVETIDLLPNGGDGPSGVAVSPDGRWIYVTNSNSGTVAVIERSGSMHMLEAMILVGDHPQGVAFAPDSATAYVANYRSHSVSVIDTATRSVTATVALPPGTFEAYPIGLAVDPRTAAVLVAKSADTGLAAIDPVTLLVQSEIRLAPLSDPTAFGRMMAPQ